MHLQTRKQISTKVFAHQFHPKSESCLRAYNANAHFIFTSNTNDINITAIIIVTGIPAMFREGYSRWPYEPTNQMNYRSHSV